jgi:hypothetical protein
MSFINENKENISYECSELIEELKQDIAEFGSSKIVAVWCKEIQGITVYTNYDYITENQAIDESELESGEYLKEMTMGALLTALEAQNTIL